MARSTILTLCVVVSGLTLPANAATISNFDDGTLQGWTRAIDGKNGTISNPGVGGNPGGFLLFTDGTVGGPPENIVAPSEFLGDWSLALANPTASTISLDGLLIDPHVPGGDDIIIFIDGPGGSANINLGLPSTTGVWESFSTAIQESDWSVTSGTWAGLLANVTSLQVQMDWVNPGGMQNGIDNFQLDLSDASAVPEPTSMALFGLTALGFGVGFRRHRKQ